MAKGRKNWKKWLKYFGLFNLLLLIGSLIYMNWLGKQIYGDLTERVDYKQFNPITESIVIENCNILSADGTYFISNSSILIEQGTITAIDSVLKIPLNTIIIDGSDKFLIPGLTDAHVHLWKSPNDLLLFIANGITTIRELIGDEDHLQWRDEIKNGRIGPDIYVASPRLGSFSTVEGWFMSSSQGFHNIKNEKEAEESVQRFYDRGYDGIKVYSHLNNESYKAVCSKAKVLGIKVMGHIPFDTSLKEMYNSGQSEIAHFEEIMNALNREFGYFSWENTEEFFTFIDKRSLEVADKLLENDIVVTTTLYGTENTVQNKFNIKNRLAKIELEYVNPGLVEWTEHAPGGLGWLPEVSRHKLPDNLSKEEKAGRKKYWITYMKAESVVAANLIKKNVKLMTGTDANIPLKVPGFSLHNEFISLQNAGMTPSQILKSATTIPAEYLGCNSGRVEKGYDANLVLLNKNPLENISNTKTINSVIKNGIFFNRALLDSLLAKVKLANDNSRKVDINAYK